MCSKGSPTTSCGKFRSGGFSLTFALGGSPKIAPSRRTRRSETVKLMAVILNEPRRLSEREAAAYLGVVTVRTMQDWRTKGVGPAYSKLGRRVCYAIEDLDAFVAQTRVEPKRMASQIVTGEG